MVDEAGAVHVSLNPVTSAAVCKRLLAVAAAEGVALGTADAKRIADGCNGDLRTALETLQILCCGKAMKTTTAPASKVRGADDSGDPGVYNEACTFFGSGELIVAYAWFASGSPSAQPHTATRIGGLSKELSLLVRLSKSFVMGLMGTSHPQKRRVVQGRRAKKPKKADAAAVLPAGAMAFISQDAGLPLFHALGKAAVQQARR